METAGTLPDLGPPPPSTNRGVELTSKVDWLTLTTRKDLGEIIDTIYTLTGSAPVAVPYAFNSYPSQLVGVAGIRIGYSETRDDVCINLPGEACTLLGTENLVSLTEHLQARASRCDVAWDGCPFTPGHLDRAWLAKNVNTRVRRAPKSYNIQRDGAGNQTIYLGAASSDTRLVCYDRRGPTRLELRLRRARAATFWAKVCDAGARELSPIGLGVVVAHADFVKRSATDSNVSRAPRLRWWASFVRDAGKIRLSEPNPAPSIARTERHVLNQAAMVATWLEIRAKQGYNQRESLEQLVSHGAYRMGDRHLALVAMVV